MPPVRSLPVLLALLLALPAPAQQEIVRTQMASTAEQGAGHAFRKDIIAATEANGRGDVQTAAPLLARVAAYCDQQQAMPGRRALAFATRRQYLLYMQDHADGTPTEWLDIACGQAYQQQAFSALEQHQPAQAQALLDIAIRVAPYYASARTERGFLYGQQGRLEQAMDEYRAALALTRTHPEEASTQGVALRGIGWVQVEQGDLDAAQASYEQSLQIEPGNPTARHELDYIAGLRAKAAGDQATPPRQQAGGTATPG